jgi:uncharacterized phage protein (predicted DNA packaging)
MKTSELTVEEVCSYIHLDESSADDERDISTFISAAKSYVQNYTGLTAAEIDTYEDITVAVLVLVQDMYDNRTYYVDSSNVNKVVESILSLHCKNLI